VGDEVNAVAANRRRICQTLALDDWAVVTAHQVHGARVFEVQDGEQHPTADALITDVAGVALMLRFADCVPVALYDPGRQAIGLVHAGWKGTVKGIARQTVWAMSERYGCRVADLIAGIGPAIGPCCYQIGENVVQLIQHAFAPQSPPLREGANGAPYLDLWEANRRQLASSGVERIEVAALCTACRHDEFFSYRGDGGRTGRFGVVLGLRR
jgi:YfiH family protein